MGTLFLKRQNTLQCGAYQKVMGKRNLPFQQAGPRAFKLTMNALSPEATASRLRALVSEKFALDPAVVAPLSRVGEDFARDLIDAAEFLLEVEAEWAVKIPEDELGLTPTLQQLTDYLVAHSPGHREPLPQMLRAKVAALVQSPERALKPSDKGAAQTRPELRYSGALLCSGLLQRRASHLERPCPVTFH